MKTGGLKFRFLLAGSSSSTCAESSTSFFDFLPSSLPGFLVQSATFSSGPWPHEPQSDPTEVPLLREIFLPGLPQCHAPEVPRGAGLSAGQQGRQPAPVAWQTGKPRLLPQLQSAGEDTGLAHIGVAAKLSTAPRGG